MTASGRGAAILPCLLARHGAAPGLVARPLVAPVVQRDIYVVTKRGRTLSPASAAFVEVLAQAHREGAQAQAAAA
jgi:DNA-binding transcriptional LysR family regulator